MSTAVMPNLILTGATVPNTDIHRYLSPHGFDPLPTTQPTNNADIHRYQSGRGFTPLRATQPINNANDNHRFFQVKQTSTLYSGCTTLYSRCTLLSNGTTPAWYQPQPLLPISFRLTKKYGSRSSRTRRVKYSSSTPLGEPRMFVVDHSRIKQSDRRAEYTESLAQHLRMLNVLEDEQVDIIQKIFEVAATAVPSQIVDVTIENVTIREYDDPVFTVRRNTSDPIRRNVVLINANRQDTIRTAAAATTTTSSTARDSRPIEWNRAKLILASKSSVDGLEKVTLDESRYSEFESEECAVCMDRFVEEQEDCQRASKKPRNDVDVAVDHYDHDQNLTPLITITRLPCSHHYHTECILQWLEINHRCPLCRFEMPIEGVTMSTFQIIDTI